MSSKDHVPPQDLTAEMAVLGAVLIDRSMLDVVSGIIRPSDFYAAIHEQIFSVMLALGEADKPIDLITLAERLQATNQLEKIGGTAYLATLMDTVQTAASAEYYAKIVREKSMLRALIRAGTKIVHLGYEGEPDPAQSVWQFRRRWERSIRSAPERRSLRH